MPIVKDRKLAWSHCLCLFTVALLFLGMPLLSGCSDDDDDEGIWVCNFDDEDYTVRLWRSNSNPDTAVSYIVDEFELDDIFDTALQIEKDSIAFYVGIKELVPQKAGKDKMDKIIGEEMRHIRWIIDEMRGE